MSASDDTRNRYLDRMARVRAEAPSEERMRSRFRLEAALSVRTPLHRALLVVVAALGTVAIGGTILLVRAARPWNVVGMPIAGWLVLVIATVFALRMQTLRSVTAERTWLVGLPFDVHGYFDTLGDAWDDRTRLHLHFSPTPDPTAVQAALSTNGAIWDHASDMDTYILDRQFETGREVHTLLRRLLGHPLLALAGSEHVTAITIFSHR